MAYMFPEKPKEFTPNSQEDVMFEALAKLPDSYYVFHSFSIVNVVDGIVHESETDFVIFNADKGLLCLEAKAGQVKYEDGCWRYGNGNPMSHDGPFNQAAVNKWKLGKYMDQLGVSYLKNRCKMLHAVWFPSVTKECFLGIDLPSEADINLLLTKEALDNTEEYIVEIFDVQLPNRKKNNMSQKDVQIMLNRVLVPSFNLVSISELKRDHRRYVFKSMLKEQVALLNYLEEQNSAVINGMAGTGKTVMAVEKAKRHADSGDNVLFLCYNRYLKEYLQQVYAHENISYYTIDGLACKLCDINVADYEKLKDVLMQMYIDGTFPYKHIVIDEGQDFGKEQMNETDIIDLLKSNVLDDEAKKGTFYLFYDKNQMIQAECIPEYISEADCKLTLYRNCRNTENIAITSLRLLGSEQKPKLFKGAIVGDSPEMYFAEDMVSTINILNTVIEQNWSAGYDNIQILTCKTEIRSIISDECSTGVYIYQGKKIPYTTCRKYKGLEADVIIMVDMNREMFSQQGEQIMYVGSSRARHKLVLIAELSDADCEKMLADLNLRKSRKPQKAIATAYNAKYNVIINE